jgi:hypothetical protein
MSSVGVRDGSSIDLLGAIQARPEPAYPEPLQVSVAATISIAPEDAGLKAERIEDRLVLFDTQGTPIGLEFTSYSLAPSIDGMYEVQSGVITEDDGVADLFVISDVVELAIGGGALAACLVLYAGQIWMVKQTLDDYRRQGLVPQYRIKSGLLKVVTCQFDIEMTALNPAGEIVQTQTVRVGRKKRPTPGSG